MISVCIATYNGEKHIRKQLDSIIPQLGVDDEIIVSDDNSSDNTINIIESFNDKRIRIFKNNKSKGVIHNVENCLEKANGKTIFLADQDDVWVPNKIEICSNILKSYDLVVSDCYVTDENLNILYNSFYLVNNSRKTKFGALMKNSYLGCCMAFNRNILDKVLPFPAKIPMHDIWIGNIAAFYYSVKFIPDKLIYYRRHGNNASTASENSTSSIKEKILFRTHIVFSLIKRIWYII
jgi:glycosyltransferase involved in cell wall biosynthesis